MTYEEAEEYLNNWKSPIPKHTKLRYEECYAKYVLERFLPQYFSNLELSDKPDLRNEALGVGVEVTSMSNENRQKAIGLSVDIVHGRIRDKERAISEIKKCGSNYTEYGTGHHQPTASISDIENKYCDKIEKLNSPGWKVFPKNYLYADVDFFPYKWYLEQIEQRLSLINDNYSVSFDILVLVYGNYICQIDFSESTISVNQYDNKDFTICSVEARLLVEKNN